MGNRPDPQLAAALKRLREERNISQEQLAYDAGITASALSRIERGMNDPRWSTVASLATALGLKTGELVSEAEGPGSDNGG